MTSSISSSPSGPSSSSSSSSAPRLELGSLRVTLVDDGEFRLDGGAMFGVVPKALWKRAKPADEQNRIRMVTNCPLIEAGDDLVLVDTGIGDKNDAKFRKIFALDGDRVTLPEAIRRAGYELGDVTHVISTHLHFDHCGWNTREDGGRLVPTFPRARYWLERGEVEHGRDPNLRDRASYDGRNWEPLFEAGVVELFDDEAEPVPGVRAIKAAGHNADMCVVRLDGGAPDAQGLFLADLVPTAAHVPTPWVMGYDLYPVTTMENKERWLGEAAAGSWTVLFEHDPDVPVARLAENDRGRLEARPLDLARP